MSTDGTAKKEGTPQEGIAQEEVGQTLSFAAMEEQLFLDGQWDELVSLYERRLETPAVRRAAERVSVLFRLGQVLEERCDQVDRAMQIYQEIAEIDPSHRQALTQLRRLHGARGHWDLAIQVAELEGKLPARPFERARFHCELGEIWLDRLGDAEQSLSQFDRALEAAPEHAPAALGRARALLRLDRPRDAADTYADLLKRVRGRERAPVLVALARLFAGPLSQPDRAFETYRRAVTDDPRNREALEALVALATRNARWPLVSELQERRFELAAEGDERLSVALEAGELELRHLSNPHGARLWYRRALEIAPDRVEVALALADVERLAGNQDSLARHLERAIELDVSSVPPATLLEAASLAAERDERSRAVDHAYAALEQAPDEPQVLAALTTHLEASDRAEELAQVLERRAALAGQDADRQAGLLVALGSVREQRLEDPQAALEAYQAAFEVDPQPERSSAAIERILRKAEAWEELRDHLEGARDRLPPRERTRALCTLGRLLTEHFEDPASAGDRYEAALALEPGCEPALRGLEQVALQQGDASAVVRAYEREAEMTSDPGRLTFLVGELVRLLTGQDRPEEALLWAERLLAARPDDRSALETCARLQQQLDDPVELAHTLERLDVLYEGAERARGRRRLARLHSRLDDEERAIHWGLAALEIEPGHVATLEALVEPLGRAGRVEELVEVHRQLVECTEPPRRTQCLDALARLLSDARGDLDGAIGVLQRLASEPEPPADVDARLEQLLDRRGRHAELVQRLEQRRRTLEATDPAGLELDLQRAEILLHRLQRWDEAAKVFRSVLDRDASSERADRGLEAALRAANDLTGLAELLERRAERTPEPAARERIDLERAGLLEDSLEDPAVAIRVYTKLADTARDGEVRKQATLRLEALLERSGDWETLAQRLEAELQAASPGRQLELHERLAALASDRLGDRDRAVRHLEALGGLAPGSAETWRRLGVIYEEQERPGELLRVIEAELRTGPAPERELTLRARAGALCVTCEDPARAVTHYQRVLQLSPSHSEAVEYLVDRLSQEERHAELVAVLEGRLAHLEAGRAEADPPDSRPRPASPDAPSLLCLRLRIGALKAGPLGDSEGALAVLEPALAERSALLVLAEPLADLYQRTGRAQSLLELCRRVVSVCEVRSERADWYLRLGEALSAAGEHGQAAQAFHQTLADRPGDPVAHAALCETYRRLGEAEPLARLLVSALAEVGGPDEVPIRIELAELLAGPLNQPAEALQHLQRVLELEPGHRDALDRAIVLAESLGQHTELLHLLDRTLRTTHSPTARGGVLLRKAKLLAGALEQPEAALAVLREAIGLDPDRGEARQELRRLLESLERWPDVLDLLYLEAHAADGPSREACFEEAARLASEHLSPDEALPWLERLLGERPEDRRILSHIADIHRQAGRAEALLRVLDAELATDPKAERSCELHLERAQILEESLGLPVAALRALEAARAARPDDLRALHRLEPLYAFLGREREQARCLEALLPRVAPGERNGLRMQLASLFAGPLADPSRAARVLQETLDRPEEGSFSRAELLQARGAALEAAGRIAEAARVAEEELTCLDPQAEVFAERRAQLHWELARRYGRELANPARELAHLRTLVDAGTREASGVSPQILAAAEAALIERLRRDRSLVELAERLNRGLSRNPEDVEGWLELARLQDEQLHRPGEAAHAYGEVLARVPHSLEAMRGLRRSAERIGDWPQVLEALEGELENDPALRNRQRAALLRRIGEIAWKKLGSTTRASRAFAEALEVEPGDLHSLRALVHLFESMEDWRGALDLYESEMEILGDAEPERRQQVWLRVAELARDRTGDPARALRAFEAADRIDRLQPHHLASYAEMALALGERERFVELFASWCDDARAPVTGADHLRLASVLEELERDGEALERVEHCLRLDPRNAEAWDAAARLRGTEGDDAGRADALERAAELVPGDAAAQRLEEAARSVQARDPERALELMCRAGEKDPGAPLVQAALTRAAMQLEAWEVAQRAAGRALDLDPSHAILNGEARTSVARAGGRSARERADLQGALQFYDALHALEAEDPEALGALGALHLELGDPVRAREFLERRLALTYDEGGRSLDLVRLARCLEAEGAPERALARLEEALEEDDALLEAHEARVRVLRASGRANDTLSALRAHAKALRPAPAEAARCLEQAARIALEELGDPAQAESLLGEALELDAALASAWILLAEKLYAEERFAETLATTQRALAAADDEAAQVELGILRARALEAQGERREAARAYEQSVRRDPSAIEAGLACARLLRGLGEWRAAAEILRTVAEHNPDPPEPAALVYHQLGRLLAGPLEDVAGAIEAYRAALDRHPELRDARHALADLLIHRPERWDEAVDSHRRILAEDPLRLASLRGLLRVAGGRQDQRAEEGGLAILKGLGAATPDERVGAPERPNTATQPVLEDPLFECARSLAQAAAEEIALALETASPSIVPVSDDPVARFRTQILACQAELSAPALVPLSLEELRTVLSVIARLVAEEDSLQANGHLVNGLAKALGRRTRRRLKRALGEVRPDEIEAIDFAAWRAELRALACAEALQRTNGSLRTALLALLGDDEARPPEEADLRPLVEAHPEARAFFRRIVLDWIASW